MLSDRSRPWWLLGSIVLGMLAIGLDVTILNVALPTLAGELSASTGDLQWFVASYSLVVVAAILLGGLLGDRYGRRRVLIAALVLFGVGSVLCAYAGSPEQFIAARVVAGLGAAAAIPTSLSVITVTFSDEQRPRAIGIWAAASFLAFPIGPVLGGWLLSHYWWGSVFLINVPVILIGIAALLLLLPESRGPHRPPIDWWGVATSSTGLTALTYGFVEAGDKGWDDPVAVVAICLGLVVLTGFVAWERHLGRRSDGAPLVDMSLFSSRTFTGGTILGALGLFAMIGLLFVAPQYSQAILGADAMGSGVRLLPLVGGLMAGAVLADRIAARIGARATVAGGFLVLAVGLAVGATTGTDATLGFLAAWTVLVGLGMGPAFATAASAALGELPHDRAGVGSAVMQAVQRVGVPLGMAILGSVLSSGYVSRLDLGALPAAAAQTARDSVFGALAVAHS
ncbi:MAG: MFS transporter [Candidatus Nanopelagicales bacterium]